MQRGEIYSPEAYARGKMLNHSGWAGVFPRNITPSDIDMVVNVPMVIDSAGRALLVELSSSTCLWDRIPKGQYLMYKNLVLAGRGSITAALGRHAAPEPGKQIDTVTDIVQFSGLYSFGGIAYKTEPIAGARWREFVVWWFKGGQLGKKKGNVA